MTTERQSPPVKDSDLIWLAIKKLEAVAVKMTNHEYDEQLDELFNDAANWFEWAAFNIAKRNGDVVDDIDIDPFERAAIIAETMIGSNGNPASGETIAAAIRAWKPRAPKTPAVSETIRKAAEKL